MEEHILKSDNGPKSPVEEYDKLVHSPTPQGRVHLYTVKPQLSGPHLSRFSVNRTTEITALLQ